MPIIALDEVQYNDNDTIMLFYEKIMAAEKKREDTKKTLRRQTRLDNNQACMEKMPQDDSASLLTDNPTDIFPPGDWKTTDLTLWAYVQNCLTFPNLQKVCKKILQHRLSKHYTKIQQPSKAVRRKRRRDAKKNKTNQVIVTTAVETHL